jgi:hypothetical protein
MLSFTIIVSIQFIAYCKFNCLQSKTFNLLYVISNYYEFQHSARTNLCSKIHCSQDRTVPSNH